MKSITDIKKEIRQIESISSDEKNELKPAAWRKLKKHLKLLRLMEKYLFTKPTETFVVNEVGRLEKIITAKMSEFKPEKYEELPRKAVTKLRKDHEKKYDIPKLRTQIRTLRFLLK